MSAKDKAPPSPPPAPAPAPVAPTAEGVVEAAEAPKVKKERKQAKPKVNVQVWKLYKVSGDSLERLRKECPRCGHGYFMADHKERLSCGHCGYTSFKNKS